MKLEITRDDLMPVADYIKVRKEKRAQVVALKKNRRLEVGPFATFHFESWDTMWSQIQEMLYIEKGGEEQIQGELDAYNPLIPKGAELVATVMFEIDDPLRRARVLARLGGVEETGFIEIGGERIRGKAEEDQDRTNAEGKASSVQFMRFAFSPAQVAKFKTAGTQVLVGFDHPEYGHLAVMPEATRDALAKDFA
ncbi:MAG: DUF3501 family protein [Rhodospirillaceae bacterium]|jgi:hypothetical protein|nr:DUF3501 family protein [Rhodospirillaceae bacterium]